jgi:hypothetical protein
MPRTIDRFYGSTLYYPPPDSNKKFGSSFHWKAPKKGPLVVFHPEFPFDPWSADTREIEILARRLDDDSIIGPEFHMASPFVPPEGNEIQILHESFRVTRKIHNAIQAFIELYPDFLRAEKDETLWWNTGFWSARCGEENWMGISEPTFNQYPFSSNRGEFAYVLCNYSTIIELSSRTSSEPATVDVYLNNRSLPWAEMRRAVLSTLDTIGPWDSTGKEFIDKEHITSGIMKRKWMMNHAQCNTTSCLEPVAVAKMMSDVYHSAIIEWKFGNTPWTQFDSMRYALASIGPYLELGDFTSKTNLAVRSFYPFFLSHCVVVDCTLRKSGDQ